MSFSWVTESGLFLNGNQAHSPSWLLSFSGCLLEGQSTGNSEVQQRAKIKRWNTAPPEFNYFWLILLNEFLAFINQREQKHSCCWERVIIPVQCEGKTRTLTVPAHETVPMLQWEKHAFRAARGSAAVTQQPWGTTLWAAGGRGSPSHL